MEVDRPLRILHVVGSAQLSSGGPIEGIRQRGLMLQKMGHSVVIVSLDSPGSAGLEEIGIPIHPCGPMTLGFVCPNLDRWLESNIDSFDVAIINGLWQYNSLSVRKHAIQHKIPYFVFTHGMLDPWFKTEYPLKHIKKVAFWPIQHRVLRDAKAVLFTTEEEKLLARESFRPYKIIERVVPYGTSRPPVYNIDQEKAFYKLAPDAQGKAFILTLGRIHPKKGHDILIEAFAEVYGGDDSMNLVIAGPDQTGWKSELDALSGRLGISHRIIWTGMLTGDAKWGAFYLSTAFVLPSHQENFGISVAEAMGSQKPVFISNKVNIWREVLQAGAGSVADDTLEGAIKLLRTLKDLSPEDLGGMAKKAETCFETHFEVTNMAKGLLNVIQELG